MPRNGSGTMTIANSFSAGTDIESGKVNANFSDVASELTGSLPRDGQASMTGQLKAASGTASAPGISFSADTNSGFYRVSGDVVGAVAGGSSIFTITTSGIVLASGMSLLIGGNAVSATPTGVEADYHGLTAPDGWVLASGKTIGNAASAATERANADTEALFTLLWNSYANAQLPVSGGRGASAAADYAANKTIALPDKRDRVSVGLGNMGGTSAGLLGSVVTQDLMGATGGAETVTLTQAQLPAASLSVTGTTNTTGSHTHPYGNSGNSIAGGAGTSVKDSSNAGDFNTGSSGNHWHTVTGNTENMGSGEAHSNMQPSWVNTKIIKL